MCLININCVFKPQYWTFALQTSKFAAYFFLFNDGFLKKKQYDSKYQAQQNSRNRSIY